MAHQIYQTECFVLRFSNIGEANRLYLLLTEDLGVIFAVAQGIRERYSKLRGNLQLFSLAKVSLVRGREVWRVVGAEEAFHTWSLFKESERIRTVARLSALVSRLVHGESKEGKLFDIFRTALLSIGSDTNSDHLSGVELVAQARILEDLGYFAAQGREWVLSGDYSKDLLDRAERERGVVLDEISRALTASQL